jgi:hypothetical protein
LERLPSLKGQQATRKKPIRIFHGQNNYFRSN